MDFIGKNFFQALLSYVGGVCGFNRHSRLGPMITLEQKKSENKITFCEKSKFRIVTNNLSFQLSRIIEISIISKSS